MELSGLLAVLLNFAFLGLLPRIFFKGGAFNLGWWVTAAPLFLCPLLLVGSYLGLVPSLSDGLGVWRFLGLLAIPVSLGSVALMAFTLGTHRTRIALWHQQDDRPVELVTHGAYRRIRHPFYSSFLLALAAALLLSPSLGTLFTFLYGLLALNFTAGREERYLSSTEFGSEYSAYMRRTGRFWPKWGGGAP